MELNSFRNRGKKLGCKSNCGQLHYKSNKHQDKVDLESWSLSCLLYGNKQRYKRAVGPWQKYALY